MKMDKVLGNFLSQSNKDFPLECETLEYLQGLSALSALAGNLGGDRVVLWGCEPTEDGSRRGAGYVFVRTRAYPEGEILPWEGGPTGGGMYVCQGDVSVNANNTEYPKAYTRRSLAPGVGDENYKWDDFVDVRSMRELMAENASLRSAIAAVSGSPLGIVEMWAGTMVPEGYVLCDGRALEMDKYRDLYGALGTTFNSAVDASGERYVTDPGYFRVPDLRGRFVVGQHDSDKDYTVRGSGGGVKRVTLGLEEMPGHVHEMRDFVMLPNGEAECTNTEWKVDGEKMRSGYSSVSGAAKRSQTVGANDEYVQWVEHETGIVGGGGSHENRPPYYVLAYIIRVKK